MTVITPYESILAAMLFLLPVVCLLVFVCLAVKIVIRVRRGNNAGVMNIMSAAVALAAGSIMAVYAYVWITTPPQPMRYIDNMPGLVGYDYNECREIYAAYFDMEVTGAVYSDDIPKGAIIEQNPKEGSLIAVGVGSTVYCTVSKGRKTVNVPNVTGLDSETALRILESEGLTASVRYEFSGDIPEGEVISASPEHNSEVYLGDCVALTVSVGNGGEGS